LPTRRLCGVCPAAATTAAAGGRFQAQLGGFARLFLRPRQPFALSPLSSFRFSSLLFFHFFKLRLLLLCHTAASSLFDLRRRFAKVRLVRDFDGLTRLLVDFDRGGRRLYEL
jgi:hypothetical protein